ncbi:LacI family repressor for deo operon, udp, cdd, tsx, nupC, and nupG [Leifsonia sp. EB41]|uniref:LacI family DNA-binding transcriptional regulator n=1 Tax=Leifsonia sp. EB41 TaxID=3156260 RepID=UPI003513AB77
MARVGISDVAEAAGVSEATVSRVINNRGIVAPTTRKTVEDAMRRVGYSKASTSNVVLLITPGLTDPFFAQLCERLGEGLNTQGFRGVIASAPGGSSQEFDFIAAMADLGIVGAVFVSASNTLDEADPSVPNLLAMREIPFVCINGAFPRVPSPTLSTNDDVAARIAVDHLWSLGHRRIGLAAGPIGNRPSDRRARGFLRGVQDVGGLAAADSCPIVHTEYSTEGGYAATETLLGRGVTAIVAASDEMALGVIRAARRRGISVPAELSVIGYDDALPLDFVEPPLTTLRQPIDRLSQAVVALLTRMVHRRPVENGELLFEPELIRRASTAPVASDWEPANAARTSSGFPS